MNNIFIISIIAMGSIGVIFSILLAYTSKKFAVKVDNKVKEIEVVLPGANCGACGYPGCSSYAQAVADEEAKCDLCSVGGREVTKRIGDIMGIDITSTEEKKIARVKCNGGSDCTDNFKYEGIKDCHAANALHGGQKSCSYSCLGLGSCERVCPFDAIYMNEKGVAEIDADKCTGCGICITECPKAVIELVPEAAEVHVLCKNIEKGKGVRPKCKKGCIACKLCERVCEFDAIKVEDNLASIDYAKCTSCMKCVEKCPTKAIAGQ